MSAATQYDTWCADADADAAPVDLSSPDERTLATQCVFEEQLRCLVRIQFRVHDGWTSEIVHISTRSSQTQDMTMPNAKTRAPADDGEAAVRMHSEVAECHRQHETIVGAVAAAVESGKRINVERLRAQAPSQSRAALYSQVAQIKKRLLRSRGLQKNRDLSVDGSTGSAAERPHQDQQSLVTSQANAASGSETTCVPRWPDVPHSDARSRIQVERESDRPALTGVADEGSAPPSHCIASGDWSESQAERQMLALPIRNGELLVEWGPSDPGRDEFQELQMRIRALELIIARDA